MTKEEIEELREYVAECWENAMTARDSLVWVCTSDFPNAHLLPDGVEGRLYEAHNESSYACDRAMDACAILEKLSKEVADMDPDEEERDE